MQLIPAIDLYEGKAVRLTKGDFATKVVYAENPKEKAMEFILAGAKRLHVVDLEGAEKHNIVNWDTLKELLALHQLTVQVGGGIRSLDDVKKLLDLGASQVVVGSIAIRTPDLLETWLRELDCKHFCIAVDVKNGDVVTHGWKAREQVTLHEIVMQLEGLGIAHYLCTDVSRDGTMTGPNISLYQTLVSQYPKSEWLASGGISNMRDLQMLREVGVHGVVIGKAIYQGAIKLDELFSSKS